jgi:RNA polymerase sigma-B factor
VLQANPRLDQPTPGSSRTTETALLFAQLERAGESRRTDLLEQVVLLNAGLALALARRYHRRGIDGEDLDQTAYLALILAARAFDPSRGHDFASVAVPSIEGGIKRHFRDHGWTIRVPRRVQEVQLLIDREDLPEADEMRYGMSTVARIADHLHVSRHEVEAALRARGCFSPASLDDGTTGRRARLLPGGGAGEEDEREAVELRQVLRPLVRDLTARDRRLLQLRFAEDRTQRSIAAELHLTQAQVSRLLTRLIAQRRAQIAADGRPTEHVTSPAIECRDVVVLARQAP